MDAAVRQRVPVTARPLRWGAAALLVLAVGLVQAWSLFGALVPLGPCGLGVLHHDDRPWTVVHAENFTERAAPRHWQGRGFVTSSGADRLTYRDLSGATLTFVPGSVNPTGCS
jgi:hypothetical protein